MRHLTIALFGIDELSDGAKARAVEWYRYSQGGDYAWHNESRASIEAFCSHFGVQLKDWSVGAFYPYYYSTDAGNKNFRGFKLKDFKPDHAPTGYCLDFDIWGTFYEVFAASGDAKEAFHRALDAGFKAWREDMEHSTSDEYIYEALLANEYEFLEDGTVWTS